MPTQARTELPPARKYAEILSSAKGLWILRANGNKPGSWMSTPGGTQSLVRALGSRPAKGTGYESTLFGAGLGPVPFYFACPLGLLWRKDSSPGEEAKRAKA